MVGYLALLDVLGFKSIITGNHVDERLQEYLQALKHATKGDDGDAAVDYVVFSDSIVLTSGSSIESFKSLLLSCSRLFGIMLDKGIPIRDAVTYGSYIREPNDNGTFVAGKAVIDAYHFENAQDWVGIMLAPPAIMQLPDLKEKCELHDFDGTSDGMNKFYQRLPWCAVLQHYEKIPFHRIVSFDSNDYKGFAIVPTDGCHEPAQVRDCMKRSCESLKQLEYLAPNPQTQRKFINTYTWLGGIQSRWSLIAQWKEIHEQQTKSTL